MYKSLLPLFLVIVGLLHLPASADEAAVRKAVNAYAESFNKNDAKALSELWSEKAVHIDTESGERTTGRIAILADISEAAKANPKARLSVRVDEVRFIKPDVAQVFGQTTISSPASEPSISGFTAILVQIDDKWLIDSIEETAVPIAATGSEALEQLGWLVGKWVDDSEAVKVESIFRWSPNSTFLIRSFSMSTKEDGELDQGTQIIGWDPRALEIRSWTFNADGSFGDGVWSQDGGTWTIKSTQTLADGQSSSGTFVMKPIDDKTISIQLVGHEIEGVPQPTSAAVKMKKVEEKTAEEKKAEATKPAVVEQPRSPK